MLPSWTEEKTGESKFVFPSSSYGRRQLEEAIAAFVVIPSPQNLPLPQKDSNALRKIDGLLTVCRLLQALGECATDENKQVSFPDGKPCRYKKRWRDPASSLHCSHSLFRSLHSTSFRSQCLSHLAILSPTGPDPILVRTARNQLMILSGLSGFGLQCACTAACY